LKNKICETATVVADLPLQLSNMVSIQLTDPYDMEEAMATIEERPTCRDQNNATLTPVLRAASWNIAAINNNPFEFWITNPNQDYESLMQGIQKFIQDPANDIMLSFIFTDEMFDQLCSEMDKKSIGGNSRNRSSIEFLEE
jgi:hypothetical protein